MKIIMQWGGNGAGGGQMTADQHGPGEKEGQKITYLLIFPPID